MKINQAIPISLFHKIEINNAFALKCFRNEISITEYEQVQKFLEEDELAGIFEKIMLDWSSVFETCIEIVKQHTPQLGTRSLDIIHVASAIVFRCKNFLTFDGRQAKLAEACDLNLIKIK